MKRPICEVCDRHGPLMPGEEESLAGELVTIHRGLHALAWQVTDCLTIPRLLERVPTP